ncbi:MAG TPA: acyl-CoA dehydrogenase family protein [Gemmatimonas sp.]|nr:acyl-CoA dehydrogenase family protein [Gemmatimonas sp.]
MSSTNSSNRTSKPSFLRGLFAGEIAEELLFPYPAPLDERNPGEASTVLRLIDGLNGMLASGLIDSRRFDEEETLPEEVIRAFASSGLLGITIPKEYGGLGLSASAYARVFGAVASIDPSLGVLIGVHCGLGGKAIVLFGNDEQKARYLPALARGETLAAYALTEPETGSDAQHIVSKASRSPDGKGWILNGRKHWIGNGHRAGVIVVFAQTPFVRDGEAMTRPTAFIVRPDMPGFRVDGTVRKLGIRGSTQAELVFEDMFVPDDAVLGEVGKGFRVAVHALNAGRLSLASGCAQGAKRMVGEMTRYGEARTQFGGPLVSFEITQRKIATLAAEAYAADAMVGALAAALDEDNVDASLEAACVKVFASELIWRAADEMVQLAGGRGFVKPWPYERYLRDARINRIFEGANEILRLFVGLNGIQEPAEELKELASALKNPIRNWVMVSEFAADRVRSALGKRDRFAVELHPTFAKHAGFVEKHVAELATVTSRMITKHKKEILQRQLVVERLADMANEIYARACTIARTQRIIDEQGAEDARREIELTDLFCLQSGRRFRALRLELDGDAGDAIDDLRRSIAARIRAEQGYTSSDAVLDVPVPPLPDWGLMRDVQLATIRHLENAKEETLPSAVS